MNIIKPSIKMKLKPFKSSNLETECLFGETVEIIDVNSDWIFCKLLTDNYCGWIKKNGLGLFKKPTHRVLSTRSFIYNHKSVKSNSIHYLPMGAKLSVKNYEENWTEIYMSNKHDYQTAFIPSKHIVEINHRVKDWVTVAEQFLGTPYKWGGRDSMGIDCSALIQLSYEAYGKKIPRNTNDIVKINKKIITNKNKLDRGCVVFWSGHVGIMVDKINCIHANAFHMKTIIEPLSKINIRMGEQNKIIKIMNFN